MVDPLVMLRTKAWNEAYRCTQQYQQAAQYFSDSPLLSSSLMVTYTDLAQSMGLLHDPNHASVIEAHAHAIEQIAAAGKVAGGVMAEQDLQKYIELGVRFTKVSPRKWAAEGAKAFVKKLAEAEANAKAPAVA